MSTSNPSLTQPTSSPQRTMHWRNTADNYGTVAKWLHWGTALLFLASYATFYFREWFTESRTPENLTILQLHLSVGVTIFVIALLRILWKLGNRTPDSEQANSTQHLAAKFGHFMLYAMMIIMPVTGYLGTGVDIEFFSLFDIPSFKNTELFANTIGMQMRFKEFERPFDFMHKVILGKWLVWLLIVGHVMAALYHHFVMRDRTLQRMTSGR